MASHTVTVAKHSTLSASTVDTITLASDDVGSAYIVNVDGAAVIYARADGTAPTVAGDDVPVVIPALAGAWAVIDVVGSAVKLISAGTPAYAVLEAGVAGGVRGFGSGAGAAVSSLTPGTGASNLGKAEDAVHTSGDVGVEMLAVRKDTAAAVAADGDYIPLIVDSTGRLHVNAGFFAGTATSTADNTVTNASETVLASNANRKAAIIQVVSGGNARVRLDGSAATTSNGTQLVSGGPPLVISMPFCPTGDITAIREGSTDAVVHVTEIV